MHRFDTTFDFEELSISLLGEKVPGVMLYGTATLCGDDAEEFFVSAIMLGGGPLLRPRGAGAMGAPAPFEEELFKRIAAVIEDSATSAGKAAQAHWCDHVAESVFYGAAE